jgi:hypothetical protein
MHLRGTQSLIGLGKTIGLAMLCLAIPLAAAATDIRGRVEALNRYSPNPFPVRGARVELMDARGQRVVAASYAGQDGMFFFSNISPGNYAIRVNDKYFPVMVQAVPRQDIAPVRLRF